jgi:hypothetical protein
MWNGVRAGYEAFPHDINERWVKDFGLPLPGTPGTAPEPAPGAPL